jgi:hypothetical protein
MHRLLLHLLSGEDEETANRAGDKESETSSVPGKSIDMDTIRPQHTAGPLVHYGKKNRTDVNRKLLFPFEKINPLGMMWTHN